MRHPGVHKSLSPRGWMSQQVFSRRWNPKDEVCKASEGMDLLVRQEQAGKEQTLPSSLSFCKLPAEGVAQVQGVS